jgi:hypothetical protein
LAAKWYGYAVQHVADAVATSEIKSSENIDCAVPCRCERECKPNHSPRNSTFVRKLKNKKKKTFSKMIVFWLFLSVAVVLVLGQLSGCDTVGCDGCFDSAACELCDYTIAPTRCVAKGTCESWSSSVVPSSKKQEFCADPCGKFDCNACFNNDAQCETCSTTGGFGLFDKTQCVTKGRCKGTVSKNQTATCGHPCELLGCEACLVDARCKLCNVRLATLLNTHRCKAADDVCEAVDASQSVQSCAPDPCAVKTCDACLADRACNWCFGDDGNNCKSIDRPCNPLTSCAQCDRLSCAACVAEPSCSFCRTGYGGVVFSGCLFGTKCSNFPAPFNQLSTLLPGVPSLGNPRLTNASVCLLPPPPDIASDKCFQKGLSCDQCVEDTECSWCKSPDSYARCQTSCSRALNQTKVLDKNQCDECVALDCVACGAKPACAWCGPSGLPTARCVKVVDASKKCGALESVKTCADRNVNAPPASMLAGVTQSSTTSPGGAPIKPPMFTCPMLPTDVVELALGCKASLKEWDITCSTPVPLPDAPNKMASLNSLTVKLSRCPTVAIKIDVVYELLLPTAVSLAAKSANQMIPMGPQTVTFNKAIGNDDIELPVWPASGVIVIPKSAFIDERRVGVALVIQRPTIAGAQLTFGLALRVCAALKTCIDVPVSANQTFGFSEVCCIPDGLQCADERAKCSPPTQVPVGTEVTATGLKTLAAPLLLWVLTTVALVV